MNDVIKYKICRDWFLVDDILFNGSAKNIIKENKQFNDYTALKGAMLSNLSSYYSSINYDPKNKEIPKNTKEVKLECKNISENCKKIAYKLLENKKVKNDISKMFLTECKKRYLNEDIIDNVVERKFLKLSLQNALIGSPIMEAKNVNNDFKQKIMCESHNKFVDAIVKFAVSCKKNSK